MADSSRRYSYLEHLSVDRLEELLDLAVNTDEEEKTEYVDAILEVIVRKEKESPTGRLTDVDKAWARPIIIPRMAVARHCILPKSRKVLQKLNQQRIELYGKCGKLYFWLLRLQYACCSAWWLRRLPGSIF